MVDVFDVPEHILTIIEEISPIGYILHGPPVEGVFGIVYQGLNSGNY